MALKKVTIYKHGVGFFEHTYEVKDDSEIKLVFRPEQLNDVLKSLTISDLNQGYISNISYDTAVPKPNKYNLTNNSTLHSLLGQLVGVVVSFKIGSELISGKIIGIQNRQNVSNQVNNQMATIVNEVCLILSNKTGIQQYNINDISSLKILEEEVQKEVNRYLDEFIEKQKELKKELKIYCKGKGKRKIVFNYLVESSIWKTSYRFVLGAKKNYIQAWGLLDNQTEEDWKDVTVSLVGGQPISFIYDLYNPYHISRPYVNVQATQGMAPVMNEEAEYSGDDEYEMAIEEEAPVMDAVRSSMKQESELRGAGSQKLRKSSSAPPTRSTFQVSTRTQSVGDLFQYTIKNPITVLKNESASIPLIDKEIKGDPILIFNESVKVNNPMSNLSITNDTDMTLEEGPVMVIEGGGYVGEALLPTLKVGEQKYVPYSVELGVNIRKETCGTKSPIFFAKIVNGLMNLHYYDICETKYIINNKTKNTKKELIIEHSIDPNFELKTPDKPFEKTETYYRFKTKLSQAVGSFKVVQTRETFSTVDLTNVTNQSDLKYYLDNKYIDQKLLKQINEVTAMRQVINDKNTKINELDNRATELKTDQSRIRSNMNSLGSSEQEKQVKQRYLTKLTSYENTIEDLIEEKGKIKDEIDKLNLKLNEMIKNINFSVKLN